MHLLPWLSPWPELNLPQNKKRGKKCSLLLVGVEFMTKTPIETLRSKWQIIISSLPMHACMHAMLLQSCPTLCDPVDRSPARDSPCKNTGVGFHALLQVVFLKWIEPAFLKSPGVAGRFFTTSKTWESHYFPYLLLKKKKYDVLSVQNWQIHMK